MCVCALLAHPRHTIPPTRNYSAICHLRSSLDGHHHIFIVFKHFMKKMKIKSSHYLCRSANDYSFSVCYGQQSSSHLVYVCVYDVHLLAACVLSVSRIHLPNTVHSTYTHLLDTCHSMSYVLDDFYVLCRCASWLVVGRMQRLIASLECDIYGVNGRKWRPNEWADHPASCTNEFHSA